MPPMPPKKQALQTALLSEERQALSLFIMLRAMGQEVTKKEWVAEEEGGGAHTWEVSVYTKQGVEFMEKLVEGME